MWLVQTVGPNPQYNKMTISPNYATQTFLCKLRNRMDGLYDLDAACE